MKYIAGVDIGNSTTECCIASIDEHNQIRFLTSGITKTTGMKGTIDNVKGIENVLSSAMESIQKKIHDLSIIRINKAAPVIGDTAMETITETIITESTMIGHNPDTPAGIGIGIGYTVPLSQIRSKPRDQSYILIVPKEVSYEEAASSINRIASDYKIAAAIAQLDEAVLIYNRLEQKIPVIDEVQYIEKIPIDMLAAVEVAEPGKSIQTLSNPYGIASIFHLNGEKTRYVVPIAKSLLGTRSAVVIQTPEGAVEEKIVPAGSITFNENQNKTTVQVDLGADEIMKVVESLDEIEDASGEEKTNVGFMFSRMKENMARLTRQKEEDVKIKDLLAVDTTIPTAVQGGLAGEVSMENAVGIAAMVKTEELPMEIIAQELQRTTKVFVKIAGVEAVMATVGALTTPGTMLPIAILDLGGGSTDAALLDYNGMMRSVHLAGAGQLITMLIQSELGLSDGHLAEEIKKYPLGKVESLFHIRMENGEITFYDDPLPPKFYGKVVILSEKGMIPIEERIPMEKIIQVRIDAKKRVFVKNALRGLKKIAPEENIRNIPNVVLVGGSALDFEIPELILMELSKHGIVAGRGNIRNAEGPRNAVATGLVLSYMA